jgi:hypothetical protein
LFIRAAGRCEWCGNLLHDDAARHHRMRRRDGGDRFANVVLLHTACHRHVHANPIDARASGFIVPTSAGDVAAQPILIRGHWRLLDDAGGSEIAPTEHP